MYKSDWSTLVYLACPYSSTNSQELLDRYRQAWRATVWAWKQGYMVYSPIAYTHPIDQAVERTPPYEAWIRLDLRILAGCDEFWVLTLPGWEASKGIQQEKGLAQQLGIPIKYLNPGEIPDGVEFPGDILAAKDIMPCYRTLM